jgi:hypothetical protein
MPANEHVQDGLLDRVPQEHKDTTREKVEEGKRVLLEEYFPEERRDQFIYRGKKVRPMQWDNVLDLN